MAKNGRYSNRFYTKRHICSVLLTVVENVRLSGRGGRGTRGGEGGEGGEGEGQEGGKGKARRGGRGRTEGRGVRTGSVYIVGSKNSILLRRKLFV